MTLTDSAEVLMLTAGEWHVRQVASYLTRAHRLDGAKNHSSSAISEFTCLCSARQLLSIFDCPLIHCQSFCTALVSLLATSSFSLNASDEPEPCSDLMLLPRDGTAISASLHRLGSVVTSSDTRERRLRHITRRKLRR